MSKKRFIQFSFIFLILIIFFFSYQEFFSKKKPEEIVSKKDDSELVNENNLIMNLKYDVKFENNTKYNITAELSELINKDDREIVNMQGVSAIFVSKGNLPLIIKSDKAVFDNKTYNTSFENNVTINYINNSIKSENLFLNFENNTVLINNNIIYEGVNGEGRADNIEINLITKDIQISMNDSAKKVKIKSKINE